MFALKIWIPKGRKTTFYTVMKEGAGENETNKFFIKYKDIPEYIEATQALMNLVVNEIGNKHGAKKVFFNREEEGASGLPPKGHLNLNGIRFHFREFPLRLYALRINNREDIVILFNGGIKSSQKNIDSKDIHYKMQEAKNFVIKIDESLQNGAIVVNERIRELESSDGEKEILIY